METGKGSERCEKMVTSFGLLRSNKVQSVRFVRAIRRHFMHTCEYASLFLSCEPVPETKKRKMCRRTSSGKRETGTNEFLCSLRESTLYQRCRILVSACLRWSSTRSMFRSPDPATFSPSRVSLTGALQVTACRKRLGLRCDESRSCLPQKRFLTVTGAQEIIECRWVDVQLHIHVQHRRFLLTQTPR